MTVEVAAGIRQQVQERRAEIADFQRRWHDFVRRWKRAGNEGTEAAQALVSQALAEGLPESSGSGDKPTAAATSLAAARAVVLASGFLDGEDYVVRHRLKRGTDPYRHHCESGWRLLQNPSPRFDLWSYWVDHLDPTSEGVDPLLHWLLSGRHRGWEPVPAAADLRDPVRPAPGWTPRRLCLFAAYDADGIVDDYVVTYLRELSRHADVYYLADGVLEPGELDKLSDVTAGAWSVPHGGYDFGSFSMLFRDLVGWDVVDTYDEVLLVNDSCFLLHPLDDVLATMNERACDWWSLQATSMEHDENYFTDDSPIPLAEAKRRFIGPRQFSDVRYLHLSSYFLAFRRPVLADPGFRWRMDSVVPQEAKGLVVHKYEIGISRYLVDAGFDFDTWLPELQSFHPLYSRHVFDLIGRGFPLAKRNFLGENPRRAPGVGQWPERLRELAPGARIEEMQANIARVTDPAPIHDAYDVRLDATTGRRFVRTTARSGPGFRRMDRESPSFSHWWAFVAGPSGRLDPGVRAVLDEVRDDPSLRKVILTRTRTLADDLSGVDVHAVPIATLEGQEAAVRCGVMIVGDAGEPGLMYDPVPARHRVAHVGSTWAPSSALPSLGAVDSVAVGSPAEVAARRVADPHLGAADVWVTGLPRHDLLGVRALPEDLALAEAGLRDRLEGRPLVVVSDAGGPVGLTGDHVAALGDWASSAGVVLGVRERRPDAPASLTRLLQPFAPLGLSARSVPSEVIVWRSASAVVAASSSPASDARAAGHALVVHEERQSGEELVGALARLADQGWRETAASETVVDPRQDGHAARRFVRQVRLREVERAEVRPR